MRRRRLLEARAHVRPTARRFAEVLFTERAHAMLRDDGRDRDGAAM